MPLDELREQIAIDADASEQTLSHLNDLRHRTFGRDPDVHELAALGSYVRDVCQGFENMLLPLIKYHGLPRPDGNNWHLTIFNLFSDPPTRPLPLRITSSLAERIGNYRGFRHVFNKRYAAYLDWEKLKPLVEDLQPTYLALHAGIVAHLGDLESDCG
jgi:hypothetical protein